MLPLHRRLAQDRDAVAEDLLQLGQEFVGGCDVELLTEVEYGFAPLWDFQTQAGAAGAGKLAQEFLQRHQLLAAEQVGVQAHVHHGAALGADRGEQLGVDKAQALARVLAVAKRHVHGAGDEQRVALGQDLAVLLQLRRGDVEFNLPVLVFQFEESVLARATFDLALLIIRHHAAQDDLGATAALGAVGRDGVGEAAQFAGEAIEGMAADVETQAFLLESQ